MRLEGTRMPTPTSDIEYEHLRDAHQTAGKAVFAAALFPFDALAFTVLECSLSFVKGFELLSGNGGYMPAMALHANADRQCFAFQWHCAERRSRAVASQVFNGKHIRTIKDHSGEKIVRCLLAQPHGEENPWIREIYDHASGYVHLSKHHLLYVIARSNSGDGEQRQFAIGDDDAYVTSEQKQKLHNAFSGVNQGVVKLVSAWPEVRVNHDTNTQLKQRYNKAA
jgi:hypothetical protein